MHVISFYYYLLIIYYLLFPLIFTAYSFYLLPLIPFFSIFITEIIKSKINT